jgi:uncharacterized delta-60 repeat protein
MNRIEQLESRQLLTAGALDPSFGTGGRVVHAVDYADDDHAVAVRAQPDGKLVIASDAVGAGATPHFAVQRRNPDGSPDRSFGRDGAASLASQEGHAHSLALQKDGKILVGGISNAGEFTVIRLNTDGSLDQSFGTGGRVEAGVVGYRDAFPGATAVLPDGRIVVATGPDLAWFFPDGRTDRLVDHGGVGSVASIHALAVAPDGGLFVAGEAEGDAVVIKLTAAGRFDPTFAAGGLLRTDWGGDDDVARAIALLPDGGLAVAGRSGGDFALARYRADGSPASRFAADGRLRYNPGSSADVATAIGVAPDGRLVLVGTTGDPARGATRLAAARFTGRGKFDRTFGDRGRQVFDFGGPSTGAAAAVTPGGNVVVAGGVSADFEDAAVAQLTADGRLDLTFGNGGRVTAPSISPAAIFSPSVFRLADGRMVVVFGNSDDRDGRDAGVMRLNADGSPDLTFADHGTRWVSLAGGFYERAAIDADGRIILVGALYPESNTGDDRVVLAALLPDGRPDTSFGADGLAVIPTHSYGGRIGAVAFQGDRILVGAGTNQTTGDFVLYRLTRSGALDPAFCDAGVAVVSLAPSDESAYPSAITAIAIQGDGKILVAGVQGPIIFDPPPTGSFALARLSADGHLDPTFGVAGKVKTDFSDHHYASVSSLLLLPDGRIVAAGDALRGGLIDPASDYVIARYRPDGSLDPTFGDAGLASVDFGPNAREGLSDLFAGPGGKLILSGGNSDQPSDVALARLTPIGGLDPTFGDAGRARFATSPPAPPLYASWGGPDHDADSVLLPDGKIVTATLTLGGLLLLRHLDDDAPGLTAAIEAGVLRIRGTVGGDQILLRRDGDAIQVAGLPQQFERTKFSRVVISALAGDDTLDASASPVPVNLDGGDGNDVLLGAALADLLVGGAGHDTLFGGRGDDTLHGDDGNDYLNPGPGADDVFGAAGNDQIFSLDNTADRVDGGAGFNRAKSDASDLLVSTEGLLA